MSFEWQRVLVVLPLLGLAACDSGAPAFSESGYGRIKAAAVPSGDAVGADPSADPGGNGGDDTDDPPVDDLTDEDRGETPQTAVVASHWRFTSSRDAQGTLLFQPDQKLLIQDLELESNLSAAAGKFVQIDRPVMTDTFQQGTVESAGKDSFVQSRGATGALDILLVVDNSGSMTEEQQNLSQRLSPLISFVEESDWRIGVVTTDPGNGCLRGLIKKGDANLDTAFASAVQAGIKGSGNERGILQAVNGLKGECNPSGSWLRAQSTVAVLIVSDEDNCSDGNGCGTDPWGRESYLYDYLSSIRQPGVNARVYGLIGHPSLSKQQCSTMAAKANQYANIIASTNGTWGSICDSDYTGTLQAISHDISEILTRQFTLSQKPLEGSLSVKLNGTVKSSGYSLHENILEFVEAPAANSLIEANYRFDVKPPEQAFVLREAADGQTLQVSVDGQPASGYRYVAETNTVMFDRAPRVREIKAVYRRGDALPREFQLPGAATQVKVNVAGRELAASEYSYQAGGQKVVLAVAPRDKADVIVNYQAVAAARLQYPSLLPDAAVLAAFDRTSGSAVSVVQQSGQLAVDARDYAPLRKIRVSAPQAVNWKLELLSLIDPETIKVSGSLHGACSAFQILGTELDLAACAYDPAEEVNLSFAYEKEQVLSFAVPMPPDGKGRWKVMVNGQDVKDYTLENDQLSFAQLPSHAVVDVYLSR